MTSTELYLVYLYLQSYTFRTYVMIEIASLCIKSKLYIFQLMFQPFLINEGFVVFNRCFSILMINGSHAFFKRCFSIL